MPKFMTYQRPIPVNKQSWGGRPGANPYRPAGRSAGVPEPRKLTLPPLLGGPKAQ
jgi:hypothetical protein